MDSEIRKIFGGAGIVVDVVADVEQKMVVGTRIKVINVEIIRVVEVDSILAEDPKAFTISKKQTDDGTPTIVNRKHFWLWTIVVDILDGIGIPKRSRKRVVVVAIVVLIPIVAIRIR